MVSEDLLTYTLDQLADIYFNSPSSNQKSALIRVIRADNLYFKYKSLLFIPRSPEQIEELRHNQLLNKQREEEIARIQQLMQGMAKDLIKDYSTDQMAILQDIYRAHFSGQEYKYHLELKHYNKSLDEKEIIYELLTKAGLVSPATDRFVVLSGLKTDFSQEQITASEKISPYEHQTNREIIQHPVCFSIDDAGTVEIDDAISFEKKDNIIEIGIHIADVRNFITKDSVMDKAARHRGSTIYLETGGIPMLPSNISSNYSSLIADETRPVVSTILSCDAETFEIIDSRLSISEIVVKDRLTYHKADDILENPNDEIGEALALIEQVCLKQRQSRFDNGAIEILKPEINFKVNGDEIQLIKIDRWSRSRRLIGELMILINSLAGNYCSDNDIPLMYRVQDEPSEGVSDLGDVDHYDPVKTDKLIRFIRPSRLSSIPTKHCGLGLDIYTQTSSPIRRFPDLVIQRQIASAIEGIDLPYSGEELFQILAEVEETLRAHKSIYQDSSNYWYMKYLQQYCIDKHFPATAVYGNNDKVTFELDEYGKWTTISVPGGNIALGEKVVLRIAAVDPDRSILKFMID
jgi:exoribonuclease-2